MTEISYGKYETKSIKSKLNIDDCPAAFAHSIQLKTVVQYFTDGIV